MAPKSKKNVRYTKFGMAYQATSKNLCKFLYYDKAHDQRQKQKK